MLRDWNIAIGNFFFRYRNFLFPCVFVFLAFTLRPRILLDNVDLDRWIVGSGAAIAIIGQLVRLVTIGYEYIHRGGKNRRVFANRLVSGGMYGITRNPMYLGNALIAVGMTLYMGAPLAYFVVIPFFLFVYYAIVCAEEEYLREKFTGEFAEYCSSVNRFVPSPTMIRKSFAGLRFDWKRSVKKDMGTVVGLTVALIFVPVWRTLFLEGLASAETAGVKSLEWASGGGLLYAMLSYLKKRKLFIFRSTSG